MHVAALHADFGVVLRQILGHALGQRRHQHALAYLHARANLVQQVVNLPLHRTNLHRRIDQPRRPDNLLDHHARRLGQLIRPRRRRNVDELIGAMLELLKRQRTVIQRRRHAKAILDQRFFARAVAGIHAAQLRHRLVRFVDEHQKVARKIIQQRRRRLARQPSR